MKKHCETILLNSLWLSAMALFAGFWFDIRFGFNIFSGAHWHYMAVQQLTPGRIPPVFYASIVIFVAITIAGLYLISRPRLRKIAFGMAAQQQRALEGNMPIELQPTAADPNYSPLPKAPVMPQPPHIVRPMALQRIQTHISAAPPKYQPETSVEPGDIDKKLGEIFEKAGYIVKKPPKIGSTKPSLWAIGMDEVLYIGLADQHGGEIIAAEGGESKWRGSGEEFTSPVWRVSEAAEKVRALFSETLDKGIQITIKPFVVMNNASMTNRGALEKIWGALGVDVFESADELSAFMQDRNDRAMKTEEEEDFESYSEYIDTVAKYFNQT